MKFDKVMKQLKVNMLMTFESDIYVKGTICYLLGASRTCNVACSHVFVSGFVFADKTDY